MPARPPRRRPARREHGGAILHTLVFSAGMALGWIGWQSWLHPSHPTTATAATAANPLNPLNALAAFSAAARSPSPGPTSSSTTSPDSDSSPRPNPRPGPSRGSATVATTVATAAATATPASSLTPSPYAQATNGALIIPVRSSNGQPREPMILMPIGGRATATATASPSAVARPGPGSSPPPAVTPPTGPAALTNEPSPAMPVPRARALPAAAAAGSTNPPPTTSRPSTSPESILIAQVSLANLGISPGSIDGLLGSQTRSALRAFQSREGLPVTGGLDAATLGRLTPEGSVYTNYVVAQEDLDRLLPLSRTWLGKSQQARLDFETVLELVAEKNWSHPNLIRRLNPSVNWTNPIPPGTTLKVPAVALAAATAKADRIRIRLAERTLQVLDADSNLLAHFPCSIAQRVEKRPVGEELHVATVAPDPNYTFDPAVFPESAEARELNRKLILQPGPNNPVGAVWIGLDKPGYGIHGTPKPEEVGRTESHGCFRLANWNARHLLQLVAIGTPVEVLP